MIYYSLTEKTSYQEVFSVDQLSAIYVDENLTSLSNDRLLEKAMVVSGLSLVLNSFFASDDIKFKVKKNEMGKPFLRTDEDRDLYVSYSHSKDSVLVAVSDHSIGVDVESTNRFKNHKGLNRWLHPDELQYKDDLSIVNQIWTRKEALTKLTGLGYKMTFQNFKLYPEEHVLLGTEKIYLYSIVLKKEVLSFASIEKNVSKNLNRL